MNKTNNNKNDFEIYTDDNGLRYSNDSFVSGIYRFVDFKESGYTYDENGNLVETTTLDPGLFKNSPIGWNVENACNWLHNKAYPQYIKGKCGGCAKAVRSAIDIGFNTDPNGPNSYTSRAGRPSWAWKYIDFLPNIGFKFLTKVSRDQMGSFSAQPGDIAVYQKGGDPSVPGHICMWTGVKWTSDFKQPSMIVYRNTPSAYIFRFVQP